MEGQTFNPEAILEQYGNMVYKIALSQMKNSYDAEDVFQEVFLRLVRWNPMIENSDHQKAWLIRVTLNVCKDFFRKDRQKNTVELSEQLPAFPKEEYTIFEYVKLLPDNYRTVIHLFYYEDIAVEDIANILDSKPSTVKSWLRRGRKALQKILGKEAPDYEWRL